MIRRAALSFMLPPGLNPSSFANTLKRCSSNTRSSLTRGVLPMAVENPAFVKRIVGSPRSRCAFGRPSASSKMRIGGPFLLRLKEKVIARTKPHTLAQIRERACLGDVSIGHYSAGVQSDNPISGVIVAIVVTDQDYGFSATLQVWQ